jgi:hypothetical protein
MNTKSFGRVTILGAWIFAGCGGTITATDGTVFPYPGAHVQHAGEADPEASALRASGAHDLPCPVDKIDAVSRLPIPDAIEYAVTGCGWRAVYVDPSSTSGRLVLLSRAPLTPGTEQAAPASPVPSTSPSATPPSPTPTGR